MCFQPRIAPCKSSGHARQVKANLFGFLFSGGNKTNAREDEIVEELLNMCEDQPSASLGFGSKKQDKVIELVS